MLQPIKLLPKRKKGSLEIEEALLATVKVMGVLNTSDELDVTMQLPAR